MDKKVHLSFKTFTLFALLLPLLILPVHALEKEKADKITSFEELEKAIVQTQEKIKENPEDVEEYCRLAQLMLKKGQYDAAKQSLQNVLNIKPNHIGSLLTLSRVYWGLYQFEKGEETFKKVEALDPENRKAQFLEATFAIDRMDFDAALSIYQSILEKKPESAEALCGIAEVFYWRDQFEESEKYIKKCLSLNPEISRAYLIQSLIHRLRQENDEWKETGLKAVELAPFDELARTNMAKIFMRGEGKMDEGYEQAQIALKINPYSYNSHLFLGTGWTPKNYKEQKIEGDEETVNKIKELLKEGDGFLLNQEFGKANTAFIKVLKLAPSNITAQIGKGTLNYHLKEYRTALSWFFKVLDIEPDYGLAHYGVCQSLLRLKDRINVRFAEIEKEFAAKDEAEPPFLREVFINYEQLDPEIQKIIRFSVKPLNNYLKVLKDGHATFYLIPFHKLLWECPYLDKMKGTRTFDKRLWDDVKGCGGFNSTSGSDWEKDVKYHRFNVVAHEFAHQVHSFLSEELKKEIKRLFLKAKKERITLDFYADFNEWEYFAVGVEAYVSEEKLADQKIGYGHTRRELLGKDPDLYNFIKSLSEQERYLENEIKAVVR